MCAMIFKLARRSVARVKQVFGNMALHAIIGRQALLCVATMMFASQVAAVSAEDISPAMTNVARAILNLHEVITRD